MGLPAELSAALTPQAGLIPRLPSGECRVAGPGLERSGWTDCSTCTSTERPGPVMGKKRRLGLPFPEGPHPCVPLHCRCLPVCVSFDRAFPSPRRSYGFQRASEPGGFLSSTLCDNGAKSFSQMRGGDRDQTVFPTCLHHLLYSMSPLFSLPCVGVCGGRSLLSPCSPGLEEGPRYGWSTGEEYGWKGLGSGAGFLRAGCLTGPSVREGIVCTGEAEVLVGGIWAWSSRR